MEDENIPPEYSPGGFSGNSPTTPLRNSGDFDFSDVFGGPPRRFSMQNVRVRYSFGETAVDAVEESSGSSLPPPWGGGLKEKPVFGEENVVRRRRQQQGDDFFDDIFRGDESYGSPRRANHDRDNLFGSSPGSRIMSPARPLPPKTELFGTSLPAQFSLPARFNKAMEFPNSHCNMDSSTNELSSPLSSSSASLSRFSNQAIVGQDEIKTEAHQVQKDNVQRNLKKDRKSGDGNGGHFHFSVYKWAGKGIPMIMPLMGRNNSKSKDISRFDRSASSNGRMESEPSTMTNEDLKVECEKKDSIRSNRETGGLQCSMEEAAVGISELRSRHNGAMQSMTEKSPKSEKKLLRELLNEAVEQPEIKDNKTIARKSAHSGASNNAMKNEGTTIESDRGNADKSSLQCADVYSVVTPGKSGVEGKVSDFVQSFDRETHLRPKADVQRRSESCRWTATAVEQRENEMNVSLAKDEAQQFTHTKTPTYRSNNFPTNQRAPYSSESLRWDPKISVENLDDPFEDDFQVQELSDDPEKVTQNEEVSEDMKALDAKIQQWSVGKKGNIRSLLSTLQYVLWPGSGWKPIPLVDLIEANSVKRAYQKALLRLHPDKLQQKGAPSHQKYIAQTVFDILQEAWDHFNTLAPL